MFKRKKKTGIPKQLSVPPMPNLNPNYKPPMGLQNDFDNAQCQQECEVLANLRGVQALIRELERRKEDLEHQHFPMIYWATAAMMEVRDRIPRYCFKTTNGIVDRGDIEAALQMLRFVLDGKNINNEKFDVDKFCVEVKDYINNDEAIKAIDNELKMMREKQAKLKESLGIK